MLQLLALLYSTQLWPWDGGRPGWAGERSPVPLHRSQPCQRPRG